MAGFTESTEALATAWLDAQKQYLDAWTKLSRQAVPGGATASPFGLTGTNPWADSFEQWSKLFGQNMPGNAREVSQRLFDLGRSYLQMFESVSRILQQGREATASATDWQEALKHTFDQFGKTLGLPGGTADPWSGFATLWGLPMSNWQRMATAFSPFPGEMEKALREEQVPGTSVLTRAARHYQTMPPVGYTREWQEQLQDWNRLAAEYLHALQDFSTLLGTVLQQALELFSRRVTDKLKGGESFDGLRAIYNLWIDCGEEAYARQVATKEFPHLQAELVNALMRMKRHEQLMLDEVMTALNMPTRQEMDTTHRRVYDLQRQVRALQDTLEEAAETAAAAPARARRAAPKTKTVAKQPAAPAKKPRSRAGKRNQSGTRKG